MRHTEKEEYDNIQLIMVYEYCKTEDMFTSYRFDINEYRQLYRFCMGYDLGYGFSNFNNYGTRVTPSLVRT